MIDIHHHCLPGIDDGPRDLQSAVALCRRAAEEGITDIIATPHVLRTPWINDDGSILDELRTRLAEAVGPLPRLHPGCEYFFGHDVLDHLGDGGAIIPLAKSRYVLVEFAATAIPPLVDHAFYQMIVKGYVPVIAHPERNLVLQEKPEMLRNLIRRGAKTQLTTASLLGDFGRQAERRSRDWLGEELIHFVATDAHNLEKRPPRVRDVERLLLREAGGKRTAMLLEGNPQAVLANRPLPYDPSPEERPPARGFLQRIVRRRK